MVRWGSGVRRWSPNSGNMGSKPTQGIQDDDDDDDNKYRKYSLQKILKNLPPHCKSKTGKVI